MRSALVLAACVLSLASTSLAQDADPLAFLEEARKKCLDHTAKGLDSFAVSFVLKQSRDEGLMRARDEAGFGYAWTAPDREEFSFEKTNESLRKPLQEVAAGFGADVTGTLGFAKLSKGKDLALATEGEVTTITGKLDDLGEFQAAFESGTQKLVKVVLPAHGVEVRYGQAARKEGLQVETKEFWREGALAWKTTYSGFRDVSGFNLPTRVTYDSDKNSTVFALEYQTVNGKAAAVAALDPEFIRAQVAEFEKNWKGHSDKEKAGDMKALAQIEDDLTSAAIAKYGLSDGSLQVREEAAKVLGGMKRTNVTPTLISAMKANDKNIRVYLALIAALGSIGDPRAVEILSKDWWNQRIGEYGEAAARAKMQALGNIRHASAVDALLDTLTLVQDDEKSVYKTDIVQSLMKLTGQDFLLDRRAWKDWWKKNRSTFKFE